MLFHLVLTANAPQAVLTGAQLAASMLRHDAVTTAYRERSQPAPAEP